MLTEEYLKKARDVDRVYGGVVEGAVGRVQRNLLDFGEVRGLRFGAFGEASSRCMRWSTTLLTGGSRLRGCTRGGRVGRVC